MSLAGIRIGGGLAIAGGLGLAGNLIGADIGANAASGAAASQAQAAEEAAQLQANATTQAAGLESNASQYATNAQLAMYGQQQQNIQPFIQAGQQALPQLQSMAANPAQFSFTQQDFQNNMDPAYQFDLQQGQQAIQRSAAATGQLMSGGTLKDLTNYAQGMASNEYQNSYNRAFNTFSYNQNNAFNRLASLTGMGQVGTGQAAQAGQSAASNIGGIATGTANSLSNLYTGSANAIGGYMTGAANAGAASSIAQSNLWGGAISGGLGSLGQLPLTGSILSRIGGGGGMAATGGLGGGTTMGGLSTPDAAIEAV